MRGAVEVAGLDPNLKQRRPSTAALPGTFERCKTPGHHGEEIARLGKWVLPDCLVAAVVQIGLPDQVAVREQHGERLTVRAQRDAVLRHHVRPVRKVGDAPEPFGLALREQAAVRQIQSHQRRVGGRPDPIDDADLERVTRRPQRQAVLVELQCIVVNTHAVDAGFDEFEVLAVEPEHRVARLRLASSPRSAWRPWSAPDRDRRRDRSRRS